MDKNINININTHRNIDIYMRWLWPDMVNKTPESVCSWAPSKLFFCQSTRPSTKGALRKWTENDTTVFHGMAGMCVANHAPAKCPCFAANLLAKNEATWRLHNFQIPKYHEFANAEFQIQTFKTSPWQLDRASMQNSQSESIVWPYAGQIITLVRTSGNAEYKAHAHSRRAKRSGEFGKHGEMNVTCFMIGVIGDLSQRVWKIQSMFHPFLCYTKGIRPW